MVRRDEDQEVDAEVSDDVLEGFLDEGEEDDPLLKDPLIKDDADDDKGWE
jgi:hypothetical protein